MELKRLPNDGDVVRLELVDRLIKGDPSLDREHVAGIVGNGGFSNKVLLCLAETDFIDSSGLWWLLECHKQFSKAGGRLVIHSVPPQVMDTLMMMRLELVLRLADDEAAALGLVRGESE